MFKVVKMGLWCWLLGHKFNITSYYLDVTSVKANASILFCKRCGKIIKVKEFEK